MTFSRISFIFPFRNPAVVLVAARLKYLTYAHHHC